MKVVVAGVIKVKAVVKVSPVVCVCMQKYPPSKSTDVGKCAVGSGAGESGDGSGVVL
jgi:hypothetical protein